MSGLKIEKNLSDGSMELKLSGIVTEDISWPEVKSSIKSLTLDFSELKYFNSVGIRSWINWVETLSGDLEVKAVRCSRDLIKNIGSIEGFLPSWASVDSILVPYYCEDCDESFESTCEVNNGQLDQWNEEEKCPSCGKSAELDMNLYDLNKFSEAV